jgi:hypothetical protein
MLGTEADPLETGDFDAFSGSAWANTVGWSTTGYNDMTLDEQGESDCEDAVGGTFKICMREYTHDYSNSSPGGAGNHYYNGGYFAEETGTDKDPKVVIEYTAATNIKKVLGVAQASIKKINGVAIADISKVLGVE